MTTFTKEFEVKWSDADPNRHLRHSAYADFATHVRFSYLSSRGFGPERFAELGFGPALRTEETTYYKEVMFGDSVRIDLQLAGFSPDGARWRLRHTVVKADGTCAARLTLSGGWIDLRLRKLIKPPAQLIAIFSELERTSDFETLPALT